MLQELCRVCLITNLQEVNKKNAPINQCCGVGGGGWWWWVVVEVVVVEAVVVW